jgi:hypothetical protein
MSSKDQPKYFISINLPEKCDRDPRMRDIGKGVIIVIKSIVRFYE